MKRRSQGGLWIICLGLLLILVVIGYLAWPKLEDSQRISGYSSNQIHVSRDVQFRPIKTGTNSIANQPGNSSEVVLTVSGYIVNHERIEISPRFLGQVRWIGVKKGDSVTNGQVLVLLDDAEQRARLIEAEGVLASARAAIAKAELDYQRVSQLRTSQVESQQTEDDMRIRLDSAKAGQMQAQGQLDLAKTYLDWTVIRSPVNGVVLEKLAQTGELVMPQSFGGPRGPSTALVALADPTDLQVEIDLNESDLAKAHLNQPCRVTPEAYPDKVYAGYVAEIAPEANRQKGTLQLKVQITRPDHFLIPELSAKVEFIAPNKSRAAH